MAPKSSKKRKIIEIKDEENNNKENEENNVFFQEGYDPKLAKNIKEDGLRDFSLLCDICHSIPRDPVRTNASTTHVYCNKCLSQCTKDPISNKKMTIAEKKNFPKISEEKQKMLDNLILKCPNHGGGNGKGKARAAKAGAKGKNKNCTWENPLSALDNHMKDDCLYFMIQCEFCDQVMERNKMEAHVKVNHQVCEHCNMRMKRKEYNTHLNICPENRVDCLFDTCSAEKPRRKDLQRHVNEFHSVFEMMIQLSKTNQEISKINDQESIAIKQELTEIKEELTETKEELIDTNKELTKTIKELTEIKEELTETKEELIDTNKELTKTIKELTGTKEDLRETKEELLQSNQSISYLHNINAGLFKKDQKDQIVGGNCFYNDTFDYHGQSQGKGVVYYNYGYPGQRYEGEFRNGVRHGQGTQYDKNNKVISKGQWEYGFFYNIGRGVK